MERTEVRAARNRRGWTMKHVAIESGISESMYCLIENGSRRPSPEVAKKIAAVLGINWTAFYADPEEGERGA